jgi:hypothetical protein
MCALARSDYAAAREIFTKMSDTGRDEPITRYQMYKVALYSQDADFGEIPSAYGCRLRAHAYSCGMSQQGLPTVVKRCNSSICVCAGGAECGGQTTSCYSTRMCTEEIQLRRACRCPPTRPSAVRSDFVIYFDMHLTTRQMHG